MATKAKHRPTAEADVESHGHGFESVQEYYDIWRQRLELEAVQSADRLKAKIAGEALRYLGIIESSNHPTLILESTIRLGQCFERMNLRPLLVEHNARIKSRNIGLARAWEARRKGTIGPQIQAHAWMTGYLAGGHNQAEAARRTQKRFKDEQKVRHGLTTIIGWYKEQQKCAAL